MPSLTEKRVRFLDLFGSLCTQAKISGIEFIVWTFDRSPAEQNALYQRGRTTPGPIVTNCDGFINKSAHQSWLAIDLAVVKDGQVTWDHVPEYTELGEYWETLGGTWGGKFSGLGDIFHFQLD